MKELKLAIDPCQLTSISCEPLFVDVRRSGILQSELLTYYCHVIIQLRNDLRDRGRVRMRTAKVRSIIVLQHGSYNVY